MSGLNLDIYSFLFLGVVALLIYTISDNQSKIAENFNMNPRYAYPMSNSAYYHSFANDVEANNRSCIVSKGLDTDCVNRYLFQTGGDLDLAMASCGGQQVDPTVYKYSGYFQQEPDYMYMSPLLFQAKSQMVPTYEYASRRHFY